MQPSMLIAPLMTDDECARIEWESRHQLDRGKLDVAAEKRERLAARLREVQAGTWYFDIVMWPSGKKDKIEVQPS